MNRRIKPNVAWTIVTTLCEQYPSSANKLTPNWLLWSWKLNSMVAEIFIYSFFLFFNFFNLLASTYIYIYIYIYKGRWRRNLENWFSFFSEYCVKWGMDSFLSMSHNCVLNQSGVVVKTCYVSLCSTCFISYTMPATC